MILDQYLMGNPLNEYVCIGREYNELLHFQIPIPLDRFLNPEESDVELIRLYFQNLLSRRLQSHWSPLLYLIAIHHVNRFIYNQEKKHTQLKHGIIQQALKSPHKVGLIHMAIKEVMISCLYEGLFLLLLLFILNWLFFFNGWCIIF